MVDRTKASLSTTTATHPNSRPNRQGLPRPLQRIGEGQPVRVMELDRSTAKQPPQHFAATAVPVEVLARLGTLLTHIANLKKSNADGAH